MVTSDGYGNGSTEITLVCVCSLGRLCMGNLSESEYLN